MKKIIITIILSIFLNGDERCNILLNKYNIDINIHSNIGWKRVCRNGFLNIYANKDINNTDTKYICGNCFNGVNVEIGSTLRSSK